MNIGAYPPKQQSAAVVLHAIPTASSFNQYDVQCVGLSFSKIQSPTEEDHSI